MTHTFDGNGKYVQFSESLRSWGKKALAQPARFATVILKTRPNIVLHENTKTLNFSRQLPQSMPVVQEPLMGFNCTFISVYSFQCMTIYQCPYMYSE